MDEFDRKLVAALKNKRDRAGLSIRALSTIVGVSFSTLARIERGDGAPDNNSKIRLLEWLGDDADEAGLEFDRVAAVHFRAMKNVQSGTVQALLKAADCLRERFGAADDDEPLQSQPADADRPVELSKDQLEDMATRFRADLGLTDEEPLDSLHVDVEGVRVFRLTRTDCLETRAARRLRGSACSEWSAMSVPLDRGMQSWAVLLNDCHTPERQRVTVLEEFWHILLGHKLTKVAKVAGSYGRTYDTSEEHDAYYLASATLLPKTVVQRAVNAGTSALELAGAFGTSPELVEYRIKRLGLWREHARKKVVLTRS